MKNQSRLNPLLREPRKPGISKCIRIVVLTVMTAALYRADAQELAALDKVYHPGEQVHVIITFAAAVDLTGGGVAFNREKLDDVAQRLWTASFNLTQLRRLQPNQYEASGAIPEFAASGTYRVVRAWSGVSDLTKGYDYPDTLPENITIRIINERKDPLPRLTDLKLVK
ncbi:MAG TPA: hypothetical protein VMH80_07835 [Bryobacteraceae bacterium]|nr:hypothetical protein [Bryobacteraceae bacterium]